MDTAGLANRDSLFADDRRTRRRRAAEVRLRVYGLVAIGLAVLALAALIGSVAGKVGGALTETYLTLETRLPAEEIDPQGSGDPDVIRKADFGGIVKDTLRARFPDAKGRSARRELNDLVSSGGAFELADAVIADPSLVGRSIDFRFLASDVADLYFKGEFGRLRELPVTGPLDIVTEGKDLALKAPGFGPALATVKTAFAGQIPALRRQIALQDAGVRHFAAEAEAAADDAARQTALATAEARAAERDRLIAEMDRIDARIADPDAPESLDDETPSVFVATSGGWLRLSEIGRDGGRAEVLVEPGEGAGQAWRLFVLDVPEKARKISDRQIAWLETLRAEGVVDHVFNWRFFTAGDSREPELAGIWGATVGTFWTMLVTFALAFPIGVLAAIYLQEFAPKNRITDFIEVNINNLAAVPSIVFGLLGLAAFIQFFGVPRSAPLAGGMVLALMTLPTIIIASRVAIAAVPPSICDAALGVGASPLQASFHHVLPLALPGILTGAILGMARALGETAPLILIGMVAFIVEIPRGITDSATVLPVQIYRWSDFPERAFEARTAAAICVLLLFLIFMNALAVVLRRRFERRW